MTDTAGRRIHEFAKELNVSSKELREQIVALGFDWDVSNHMKVLTGEQVDQYNAKIAGSEAAPKRIHELAKEMGISSKELREQIIALGFDWDVSNHMKSLSGAQQGALSKALDGSKKKPAKKKPAKKKDDTKKKPAAKAAKKKDDTKKKPAAKAAKEDSEEPQKARSKKKAKEAGSDKPTENTKDTERRPRRDERRPRHEDVKDPEGFDPVSAGVPYVKALLKHLGLPRARVSGTYDGRRLEINIKGGGAVALIGATNAGANGRMLDALQLLASKVAFGDLSRARTLAIDVDGFRYGRIDTLQSAGRRIAKFVADNGVHVRMPAMNNFDRYAFHKSAGRDRGVEVGSEGFGAFRMLGIAPRRAKQTDQRPPKVEEPKVKETPVEAAGVEVTEEVAAPVEGTKRRRRRRSSKSAE